MINVLLIDRERLFQKAFLKLIEKSGDYNLVGVAESGAEAMRMTTEFRPEIIFSEVSLGHENGIEICKNIKHNYPEVYTYIISNYRDIDLMNKAQQAGMEHYYIKPISNHVISNLSKASAPMLDEDDTYMREFLDTMEERNYMHTYESAKKYTEHIFVTYNDSERKDNLAKLGSVLFDMIPGLDRSQQDHYLKKYHMTKKILTNKVLCFCWVMQIVTEVYRQLCVMKYMQVNRVLQYIENNLNNEISLNVLSEQAGVSSGYLSRIFKKYYHISVVDYIHLRKILVAKQYMISSEMNISDIAFLLGYSEAGYFCKVFKKYEHITPSAFNMQYN